jgi:hypothetical protein
MTARRAGTLAVALVAAGVVLAVVLVTWAASIGPRQVLRGEGWEPGVSTSAPSAPIGTPTGAPFQDDQEDDEAVEAQQGRLHWLVWVVNVATVVVALLLVVRLVRGVRRSLRARRLRAERRDALDEAAFAAVPPAEAVARELAADADAQRDLLTTGTPRNAIVTCWHRFEVTAAAAGIQREPWETSSEHVLRVLDLVAADTHAVVTLAGLYREARFSGHELGEDDRAAALAALDEIHRTVPPPSGVRR